jgi:signal recognition particle GTPase
VQVLVALVAAVDQMRMAAALQLAVLAHQGKATTAAPPTAVLEVVVVVAARALLAHQQQQQMVGLAA